MINGKCLKSFSELPEKFKKTLAPCSTYIVQYYAFGGKLYQGDNGRLYTIDNKKIIVRIDGKQVPQIIKRIKSRIKFCEAKKARSYDSLINGVASHLFEQVSPMPDFAADIASSLVSICPSNTDISCYKSITDKYYLVSKTYNKVCPISKNTTLKTVQEAFAISPVFSHTETKYIADNISTATLLREVVEKYNSQYAGKPSKNKNLLYPKLSTTISPVIEISTTGESISVTIVCKTECGQNLKETTAITLNRLQKGSILSSLVRKDLTANRLAASVAKYRVNPESNLSKSIKIVQQQNNPMSASFGNLSFSLFVQFGNPKISNSSINDMVALIDNDKGGNRILVIPANTKIKRENSIGIFSASGNIVFPAGNISSLYPVTQDDADSISKTLFDTLSRDKGIMFYRPTIEVSCFKTNGKVKIEAVADRKYVYSDFLSIVDETLCAHPFEWYHSLASALCSIIPLSVTRAAFLRSIRTQTANYRWSYKDDYNNFLAFEILSAMRSSKGVTKSNLVDDLFKKTPFSKESIANAFDRIVYDPEIYDRHSSCSESIIDLENVSKRCYDYNIFHLSEIGTAFVNLLSPTTPCLENLSSVKTSSRESVLMEIAASAKTETEAFAIISQLPRFTKAMGTKLIKSDVGKALLELVKVNAEDAMFASLVIADLPGCKKIAASLIQN